MTVHVHHTQTDFMFQPRKQYVGRLRSQIVTSNAENNKSVATPPPEYAIDILGDRMDTPSHLRNPRVAMLVSASPAPVPHIENRILVVRGHKVLLDVDLAELYGVATKRLNEQVKRNSARFPTDFMFRLSAAEKAEVVANCDHLQNLKFSKSLPYAFTEHGAMMAGFVLNTPRAVEMSVYVVRAFARLREALTSNLELAAKLDALERKTELLSLQHESFAGNTRAQLKQAFDTLRQLMTPPDTPKRPIGFITPPDNDKR